MKRLRPWLNTLHAVGATLACFWFLIAPAVTVLWQIRDPGLRNGAMPAIAVQWHQRLAERFEPWARERVASGRAQQLSIDDVSGTEWPMFSAVFFLWTTEAVQAHWDANGRSGPEPVDSMRAAIDAAVELIADQRQATWVKQHWGRDYLDRKNLFYRMLLISGLDSHDRLGGDGRFHGFLMEQVELLGRELDGSPHGLVEDYPGQTYPVDVLLAYAAIVRVQRRMDTVDPAFIIRARRAFEGAALDAVRGLPAYVVDAGSGEALDVARGVGLSAMLVFAPELWPETARDWYARYHAQYWQSRLGWEGFREYPRSIGTELDWSVEVDAGPVLAGFGTAANAFGLGAARTHGRMQEAFPLAAEALLAAWPLPDGTLLGPRLTSNFVDAPYIGEAAFLFNFSRAPQFEVITGNARVPPAIWFLLIAALALGIAWPFLALRRCWNIWRKLS